MADKPNHEQPDELTLGDAAKQLAFTAAELETTIERGEIAVVETHGGESRITVEELHRFVAWENARQLRALKTLMDYSNEIGFDE